MSDDRSGGPSLHTDIHIHSVPAKAFEQFKLGYFFGIGLIGGSCAVFSIGRLSVFLWSLIA